MTAAVWIAVDWGTSHLRVWHMGGDSVLARRESGAGMATLGPAGFEQALAALLPERDATLPVIVCGMAGSHQGWVEAPYAPVPCAPPSGAQAVRAPARDARLQVFVLPGVRQDRPADVMRGEETAVAGFLALNKGWDGVVCLPGTHSKWVHVSAGEIVSFRTFLTGELFALLAGSSILRHSVGSEGWDAAAFEAAVSRAMGRPAGVAADLFALRAESLLHGLDRAVARSRLSGLLIGIELAAARPYWLGQQVALLGETGLVGAYRAALAAQAVPVTLADADRMTLEGLKAARAALQERI
jgi:2-dehydro-3-deoxygalactonokinase